MFDNLKIGAKLSILSGLILLLLAVTVIWAAFGLSTAVENGSQASYGNRLASTFAQLEIKHDGWNNKVRDFLTDTDNNELKVKTDHKTCALGKWFYSDKREEAEQRIPEVRKALAALEEPHRHMHLSAEKIKRVYQPSDPELPATLHRIEKGHLAWATIVQAAVLSHSQKIDVHFDPTTCILGQFLNSAQAAAAAERSPAFAELLQTIDKPHRRLHQAAKGMDTALRGADRRELYSLYDNQLDPSLADVRLQLEAMQKLATQELEGLQKAEQIYHSETQPSLAKLKEHLHDVDEIAQANVLSDQAMISAARNSRNGIVTVGMIALLLGMTLAFVIGRSLTTPMKKTVAMLDDLESGHLNSRLDMQRRDEIGHMATTMDRFAGSLQSEVVAPLQQLASGDLTFEVQPRDEQDQLRNSLRKLGTDLNNIITQIHSASEQIDSGSSQVSESAQALSDGAAQSAASVEQISSSMNEIGSQTQASAENAQQANQLAETAKSAADTGSARMGEMISAMSEINQAGQDISKIIKVIDEIAFQTNLLALNAAVEAARAGQHGKGFAVVAEEVRNLAARSAKAASETSELIEGSVAKASNGTQIAERTAEALEEIVGSVTKVTDLVGEIASASNEQAQGISQTNTGLQQIDQVIQQNTAGAEESASTSEELSSQAAELKHQLSRFILKRRSTGDYAPAAHLSLPAQNKSGGGWDQTQSQATSQAQTSGVLLQWQDSFNTGVTLMDQQHRRLVELINQLFQCMKDGGDRMVLGDIVDELVSYTVTHFRAEEDVMRRNNYPGLEEHKIVHENFIEQVGGYVERIKAGDRLPAADVYRFLKDWLVNHIEKQDRDGYGKFIGSG